MAKLGMINGSKSRNPLFDDHKSPHLSITCPQIAMFYLWMFSLLVYIIWIPYKKISKRNSLEVIENNKQVDLEQAGAGNSWERDKKPDKEQEAENNVESTGQASYQTKSDESVSSNFSPVTQPADLSHILRQIVILGIILFYFYLSDYAKVLPRQSKTYNRDTFLFIIFILFLVGVGLTIRSTQDHILNRDQTEEWKGWMQVMFVWYHYFDAKEWYNWIRIYIAAYVWMTGFGNFSFFWTKKDYTLWRVLKMLFRLNFLVVLICLCTSNEYMLYYICAMHTYWFLSVYAMMSVMRSWNSSCCKMAVKFLFYAVANAFIFDVPGVCKTVFRPLRLLFGYQQPFLTYDVMHEWEFRGWLDHWACFCGMLCAYNYTHFKNFLLNLEKNRKGYIWKTVTIKIMVVTILLVMLYLWYYSLMGKEKFDYNKYHPYTSTIPIVAFAILRNIPQILRTHYVYLFAFLGKITLETYLCQLHIYLQSNAKELIQYIPGYPLLNFSMATIIYLVIAYVLFQITLELSSYMLPQDSRSISKRWGILGISVVICYILARITKMAFSWL